ncbi:S-layer protein [Methanocaldococcus infernus ME]|uniref:S-layer protein n=1 Tax=Methanocaldococcus infernus (strain DSM 11812 / JCM 15783 / ME) TaxID=573063 RepID=D5VT12_METIM|nr:S-layer protein [Methanocaldococcus infernus]ADG13715.1 S-layer protein [Methanocaldococcus infernus ME]
MAMSLKKIGAIAVGGAMVATALASGVSAEVTVIGEVSKDIFVKDGQPNCYVVVGANAPSTMDVVSAADVAAAIGSLCYKESTVDTGKACLDVHVCSKSDDELIYDHGTLLTEPTIFITASDSDYADDLVSNLGVLDVNDMKDLQNIPMYNAQVSSEYALVSKILEDLGNPTLSITFNINERTITNAKLNINQDNINGNELLNDIKLALGEDEYNKFIDAILSKDPTKSDIVVNIVDNGDGTYTVTIDLQKVIEKLKTVMDTRISLGSMGTMLKIDDIDPSDWYDIDDDAGEVLAVIVKPDPNDPESYVIDKKDALYMSLAYLDGESNPLLTRCIDKGMVIPFLGSSWTVGKVDADDDYILLGKCVYSDVMQEGTVYDLGNGYQVKVSNILQDIPQNVAKVKVEILKNGQVVKSEFKEAPFTLYYKEGDIAVVVHKAWQNIPQQTGFAELKILTNCKELDLGKEYVPDWKIYAVVMDNNKLVLSKDIKTGDCVVGIALRYEGDKLDGLENGDELSFPEDYAVFKFDDEDKKDRLYVYYSMDTTKSICLKPGQEQPILNADIKLNEIEANAIKPCPVSTPIAKLDTEISLDAADKNLVLIGGPVANKLTKELVDMGKISLDNDSPATIAVIPGAANGHDVVVVAGGDRYKTREAAKYLIEKLAELE